MSRFDLNEWSVESNRYGWIVTRSTVVKTGDMKGQTVQTVHGNYTTLDNAVRSLPEHIIKNADLNGILAIKEQLQDLLAKVATDYDRKRIRGKAA